MSHEEMLNVDHANGVEMRTFAASRDQRSDLQSVQQLDEVARHEFHNRPSVSMFLAQFIKHKDED